MRRGDSGAEVLLTGATGFLGKVVLHELVRRREELGLARVHVVVRGKDGVSARERFAREVVASPCFARLPEGWEALASPVEAELTRGLGRELAAGLTHVIHCAASVEFHLPLASAAAANVTSALHVLELARECPSLRALVDVSTAYVTPHPGDDQPVEERLAPLRRPASETYGEILAGGYEKPEDEARLLAANRHPNTYTFTKCLAEHLLCERGGVPLSIVRPSIVSAARRFPFPGWIDSPAAFALFAMMVGTGRMRAMIARPEARLDLVAVDAVAARVIECAFESPARSAPRIVHAVAGAEQSPTLAECVERVQGFFRRQPVGLGRGPVPGIRYLGPDGWRYRLHHALRHRLRAESRSLADRMAETNRAFAYFTEHTFRFRVSRPCHEDPAGYLDVASRGIWKHLLGGDESEVPLAGRGHRRTRGDLLWALSQPQGNVFVRLAAWAVAKTLRRGVERVSVDEASFREAMAAAPAGAALVLAPSHRSYLDFVLVSFLCFARPDLGIAIPHVAAAIEFSRIPLLGWLFRRLQAFYLERGRGGEDKALTLTVHRMVYDGAVLEFFIEGRRSRSRRFLPPHRGLLRTLQSTGRTVALLPVAISYDHVPEEATLLAELGGAPRPPMRLRDLLRWTWRLLRGEIELGRIHVACGRPLRLDLASDVHWVAHELVGELQARSIATTHHLRAFLSRTGLGESHGLDVDALREIIGRRGGRVLDAPTRALPVPGVTERCMRYQFIHFFYAEAAVAFAGNPAVEHHIRRNSYAPAQRRDVRAELADPTLAALLRALFDPIRRDYAAAARALAAGAPATPGVLLQRIPGAHLPDLEAACEDLAARGLVGRPAELLAYAASCEAPCIS